MMPEQPALEIRRACPADEAAIARLLQLTSRPSTMAWRWQQHLEDETFLVTLWRSRLVGAILAWPDAGPVAWVRLGTLDGGFRLGPWLDQCLPLLIPPLRRLGARMLAWMDVAAWAGPALQQRGFRLLSRLVTMVKKDRRLPPIGAVNAVLRPATAADLPALLRLDHAAFSPPWWLGGATLERARREALCFLVAEREGRLLGYSEAQFTPNGAHIGRLAVSPLAQGQGVGQTLLASTLRCLWQQRVTHVTLNTQESNLTSQRLYAAFGFVAVPRRVVAWQRAI